MSNTSFSEDIVSISSRRVSLQNQYQDKKDDLSKYLKKELKF